MDKFTELYEQLMETNNNRRFGKAMQNLMGFRKPAATGSAPALGHVPSGSSRGYQTSAKQGEAMHRAKMDHRSDREKDMAARAAWETDPRNPEYQKKLAAQRQAQQAAASKAKYAKFQQQQAGMGQHIARQSAANAAGKKYSSFDALEDWAAGR